MKWALVSGRGGSEGVRRPRQGDSAGHVEAIQTPLDLRMLDDLAGKLRSAKTVRHARNGPRRPAFPWRRPSNRSRWPSAVSARPSGEIRNSSRPTAIAAWRTCCWRNREGALAVLEDSDPNLAPWLQQFCPELALPPERLDRAIVYGRMGFDDAVEKLAAAQAEEARVAMEKKGVADAEAAIAKKYVSPAVKSAATATGSNRRQPSAPRTEDGLPAPGTSSGNWETEAAAVLQGRRRQGREGGRRERSRRDWPAWTRATTTLNNSENLRRARQSALRRVRKGQFRRTPKA